MPTFARGTTRPLIGALVSALLVLTGCDAGSTDATVASPQAVLAEAAPTAHLYRSPTCECCRGHADHLLDAGFEVSEHVVEDVAEVKRILGVPRGLSSCHTTVVGGYVVEGHVPAEDIRRLLAEAPDIDGVALPGMPAGSPGMPGELRAPLDVRGFVDGADAGTAP